MATSKAPKIGFLTKQEYIEKFPEATTDDINFHFSEKKILNLEREFITVGKYDYLIRLRSEYNNYNVMNSDKIEKKLTELQETQIKNFEEINHKNREEGFNNQILYWQKLHSNEKDKIEFIPGLVPDKKNIYLKFLISYKLLNGFEFLLNEETISNIEPIIKYFSFDKSFSDSKNFIKKVGNKDLVPSFKKGLLIIGDVGNGKTSVMKAMNYMIDYYANISIDQKWNTSGDWHRLKFKFKTTESLASDFEYLSNQELKDAFYKKYIVKNLFLDDLKKEKNASNYGITNVVGTILDKRYNNLKNYTENNSKSIITHGTMNFYNEKPGDIFFALQEYGLRYGEHSYDRLFEIFNIIEFKGKSFRK